MVAPTAPPWPDRLRNIYQTHQNFILLLILFVSFRLLTLAAYRPGGLVLDFSDFYWYRGFAELDRQGYVPYDTLWTTYPPLFPLLMINVWKISTLLPPWTFPNLWFTMLLGSIFLLFETANFILLYLMALAIYPLERAFKPAWIYAALFVPVYTLTGWFESYPMFFFLLGLYLLLRGKPYWSALSCGIGFMIKLIPLILLPIGARLIPRSGAWGRLRIPALHLDLDIKGVLLYSLIFFGTVIAIGLPFYRLNPNLILGPFIITSSRPPWETVWALLDGNFTYGIIPLDMRDLTWTPSDAPVSRLPWGLITVAFGLLYAFFYTRHIDWNRPRPILGFAGLTVCLFFLYAKGYSPQWLGWLLFFSSLLLPNLRGVSYAVILSLANIVEANFFFIMFPEEEWLLTATVLIRTALIILLALEFCLVIWPHLETETLIVIRRYALLTGLVLLLLGLVPALGRLQRAYLENRLTHSPYGETIRWLQEQPVKEALLLNDHRAYDWFYPYLRKSHTFYMLDDYADPSTTVEAKTTRLLAEIAARHRAVWVFDVDPASTTPAEAAAESWLAGGELAHQADIDGGRLYLYLLPEPSP